jgi:hypothetical protein
VPSGTGEGFLGAGVAFSFVVIEPEVGAPPGPARPPNAFCVPACTRLVLLFAGLVFLSAEKLPTLPVAVPVPVSTCPAAYVSADCPPPSSALPVVLPWSSVEVFWILVPIDHTLTAPPTPTAPNAPLALKPVKSFRLSA